MVLVFRFIADGHDRDLRETPVTDEAAPAASPTPFAAADIDVFVDDVITVHDAATLSDVNFWTSIIEGGVAYQ